MNRKHNILQSKRLTGGILETTGSFVADLMLEKPDFTALTTLQSNYQAAYGWPINNG